MASAAPKFTSFRPKPKDSADPVKETSEPERRTTSEKASGDRNSDKRSRHGRSPSDKNTGRVSKSERSAKGRSLDEEASIKEDVSRSSTLRDSALSNTFFSDRRGDRDILRYGSLNRHDIPDYRRVGYGYVLGLSLNRKIDRDVSTDKAIVLSSATKRREERFLASKHTGKERSKAVRFIKKLQEEKADDLDNDFIEFSATRKRKRAEDELGSNSHEDFDYRGLGDTESGLPADSDAEYESETTMDHSNAEVIARNSALVRKTKDHPNELQAWLDLIEYQEAMMKAERSSSELRSADRQHLADVRVSIYEQAIRKVNASEFNQAKLYCGMMCEARKAWSETQVASKWTEVLAKFPFNAELWVEYLNFVQSNFTGFKYEICKVILQKCLKDLQVDPTTVDTNLCLYIFGRLISLVYQAGYQEQALAIWQALLEFHIMMPVEAPCSSEEEALLAFGGFWECEIPRVGEDNAQGWHKTGMAAKPFVDLNATPIIESNPEDPPLDDFRKREVDCMSKLRLPGRTVDEIGEDDPFHTVLFSDVELFMKLMPDFCDEAHLLSAFLQFCNLPSLALDDLHDDRYILDPFLQTELDVAPPENTTGFVQLISKYANCPIKKFQSTPRLLFDQGFPAMRHPVDIKFVRNVLKLLVYETYHHEESIGEYLLAFESNYFPSEAFKTAKQLLRTWPTSLRLYNAYGILESRRNNSAKADQVFGTALTMQKGDTPFSTPYSLQLFHSWVWEALYQQKNKEALWRLVSPNGKVAKLSADPEETPNQAALLRAQKALSDTCERALLGNDPSIAALATSLLALLAYLCNDEKSEPALTAFDELSKWFASHKLSQSPAAELHAQYIADFLTYHTEHAPIVKPALLRETLDPLIAAFPDNTVLLSVYAANEARFAIEDRVRSIMYRDSNEARSIVGWTFAIHHETLRGEIAGSTAHSIRALYTRAEDSVGAHCPLLWKQHLLFEIAEARRELEKRPRKRTRKDGKRSKEEARVDQAIARVKDTFFRGLTRLPWCKTYMMMAFTHLGDEFLSQEELRKVYNVMAEKELRLYVELEETGF
ncbi:hypothetical protein GRF29_69g1414943 [Pseudopithomyces chartarum]|uniref:DUF1740-domain-containing protein n=1 Tax=Pseudopithomyces chartarum TaxID=1892770 RepID=A0AAN6M1D8_9PLEO|nr:hypothetical protein GRF29_69g1414943 [Pseudopithomyces chartarum]